MSTLKQVEDSKGERRESTPRLHTVAPRFYPVVLPLFPTFSVFLLFERENE